MTVTDPPSLQPSPAPLVFGSALRVGPPALLLSLAAGVSCVVALGATTGTFFGMVAAAALLTPPLAAAHLDRARQLVAAASVVDGLGLALLLTVFDPYVTPLDWVRAYLLLTAFALALWGVTGLLLRVGAGPLFASAGTTALALAWLAWPVWLSPWAGGRAALVAWLTPAHPLLALDGALRHLGPPWTEHHWMYTRLSVLNQDVPYALPRGVGWAVVVHAAVGLGCLPPYRALTRWTFRRRPV